MTMPQVAFDTSQFVKELEHAGLETKIAEAQAQAQVKILSNLLDRHVATKDDIKDSKTELKNEIIAVRIELIEVKAELKNDINEVRNELNEVRTKIDSLEQKLTTKFGRILYNFYTAISPLIWGCA